VVILDSPHGQLYGQVVLVKIAQQWRRGEPAFSQKVVKIGVCEFRIVV